jgi:hypothetical protein
MFKEDTVSLEILLVFGPPEASQADSKATKRTTAVIKGFRKCLPRESERREL